MFVRTVACLLMVTVVACPLGCASRCVSSGCCGGDRLCDAEISTCDCCRPTPSGERDECPGDSREPDCQGICRGAVVVRLDAYGAAAKERYPVAWDIASLHVAEAEAWPAGDRVGPLRAILSGRSARIWFSSLLC